MRKIPMRTCIISKEKCPKQELVRIVRTPEGSVVVDVSGKMNGHGAYVKKDIDVIKKARKTKLLDRALEVNISEEIYDELEKMC